MAQRKSKQSRRSANPRLSKALTEELVRFIEYHPAKRLSVNLRRMLLEYMMCEGTTENTYISDLLYDLAAFFELLDLIQSESGDKQ